jgi:hypothetical protein
MKNIVLQGAALLATGIAVAALMSLVPGSSEPRNCEGISPGSIVSIASCQLVASRTPAETRLAEFSAEPVLAMADTAH